jgi:hypothetical protein
MDNVQDCDSYVDIASSQTYWPYADKYRYRMDLISNETAQDNNSNLTAVSTAKYWWYPNSCYRFDRLNCYSYLSNHEWAILLCLQDNVIRVSCAWESTGNVYAPILGIKCEETAIPPSLELWSHLPYALRKQLHFQNAVTMNGATNLNEARLSCVPTCDMCTGWFIGSTETHS